MAKKQPKATVPSAKQESHSKTNVYDFLIHLTEHGFKFLSRALWPFTSIMACYFVYLAVAALSGKATNAAFVANIVANWGLDTIIPYLVGATGTGYGVYERRLRLRTTRTLREQAEKLENLKDPERTGTGLLPGGDMPKEL